MKLLTFVTQVLVLALPIQAAVLSRSQEEPEPLSGKPEVESKLVETDAVKSDSIAHEEEEQEEEEGEDDNEEEEDEDDDVDEDEDDEVITEEDEQKEDQKPSSFVQDAIDDSKFEWAPYGQVIRPGACGAGIFTSGNLGPQATYQKALAVFVRSCAGGAGAHPKVLCESGADELFKGKDMAALFSERPDGAFCKSLKDIQKTHRDWKRAQRQAMMLGRTKEQKHAFARLENAVQGKGGYRRRRHFRRRRAPDSCKWNRRRCG